MTPIIKFFVALSLAGAGLTLLPLACGPKAFPLGVGVMIAAWYTRADR